MRLPGAERAIVDLRKLTDYCLNTEHPRGRHKARVFEATLGFTAANAWQLREMLLTAARSQDAMAAELGPYGQLYVVDFPVRGLSREVIVRSHWIVRRGEDFPRLISCYVR